MAQLQSRLVKLVIIGRHEANNDRTRAVLAQAVLALLQEELRRAAIPLQVIAIQLGRLLEDCAKDTRARDRLVDVKILARTRL